MGWSSKYIQHITRDGCFTFGILDPTNQRKKRRHRVSFSMPNVIGHLPSPWVQPKNPRGKYGSQISSNLTKIEAISVVDGRKKSGVHSWGEGSLTHELTEFQNVSNTSRVGWSARFLKHQQYDSCLDDHPVVRKGDKTNGGNVGLSMSTLPKTVTQLPPLKNDGSVWKTQGACVCC